MSRSLRWWILILAGALALRAPLWSLPGIGRDEATYLDWSRHAEPAYAPLLQWLLRASTAVDLPGRLELRLPVVVSGLLVLWLFDRVLRVRAVPAAARRFAVAALALCPWQTYVGSILHPDDLLLAAVLAFAWAALAGSAWGVALAGALALLAKPSGLLVSLAAAAVLVSGRVDLRRGSDQFAAPTPARLLGLGVLVALASFPLSSTNSAMVDALRSFGQVRAGTSVADRLGLGLLGLAALGGPALAAGLGQGVVEAVRRRQLHLVPLLGGLFLTAFGGAALLFGQIKGNWILPAALLLWPADTLARPPLLRPLALTISLLLSTLLTLGFLWPDGVRGLETRVGTHAPDYLSVAGRREEMVSSTRAWWQRLAEYRGLEDFCSEVERLRAVAGSTEVRWLVSDDYGLAARWAATCPTAAPRLVFPLDPLFAHRRPAPPDSVRAEAILVLAVRVDPSSLLSGRTVRSLGTVAHPLTGEPIVLAQPLSRPEE